MCAPLDPEALIEEARRRARRRRQRNLAGLLAAMLGALWLYSLVGGGGPESGSAFLSETSPSRDASEGGACREELSFNANGSVVLIRRDGTRRVARDRRSIGACRTADRIVRLYDGIEWSPDGSKLLALRWGSARGRSSSST